VKHPPPAAKPAWGQLPQKAKPGSLAQIQVTPSLSHLPSLDRNQAEQKQAKIAAVAAPPVISTPPITEFPALNEKKDSVVIPPLLSHPLVESKAVETDLPVEPAVMISTGAPDEATAAEADDGEDAKSDISIRGNDDELDHDELDDSDELGEGKEPIVEPDVKETEKEPEHEEKQEEKERELPASAEAIVEDSEGKEEETLTQPVSESTVGTAVAIVANDAATEEGLETTEVTLAKEETHDDETAPETPTTPLSPEEAKESVVDDEAPTTTAEDAERTEAEETNDQNDKHAPQADQEEEEEEVTSSKFDY
jgi:hypothetical protein